MKKFILLNIVLSTIFLLVACKPLYRVDKWEYYPTKTIKTFEGGKFNISTTAFNPSICRIRDSLVSPWEKTSLCLGDYMKSIYISRPYIYVWYINNDWWSESYDENWKRILYIMEMYPYVLQKDDIYPEYLKFDYITWSGWIYSEPNMLELPETEQKIFTDLKKDGRLIIDGIEYYNGPYHWEDGEYAKWPAKWEK